MVDSISKTLGAGSGIDIGALVTALVDNQYSLKTKQFTAREETLTAQVSAVAKLKSGMSGFATALASLVKGGSLATQPTSGNTGIVKVAALPGASIANLSTSVEVRALASAQVASTATPLAATATPGQGSISFQFGSYDAQDVFQPDATVLPPIAIAATDTLSTIATKINSANQGITASVISDAGGQRLVLKGPSGAEKAFTLTAAPGSDAGVQALEVGAGKTGTTIASTAADARVAVDGVEVRRATNSITDLIPGVRLDLQSVAVGTRVTIGSTPQTDNLRQAVNDVVATYNELHTMLKADTDPFTGVLARDIGARDMQRALAGLTLTPLRTATDGSPTTLAEIGVTTNRDGSLSVDSSKLARALNNNPKAVEAMFADGTAPTGAGLSAALSAISAKVANRDYGLGASEGRYTKAQSSLSDDKLRASEAQEVMRSRLTQQFASMDSKVAVYKSTQNFLSQQIAAWNSSN